MLPGKNITMKSEARGASLFLVFPRPAPCQSLPVPPRTVVGEVKKSHPIA